MSPHSLDPGSPRDYRRRATVIVAYGLSGVVLGTAGLLRRDLLGTSSIGAALKGPVDELWLLTFAVAGALAAFGVLALRPQIEIIGDWLLMAGTLINALAIVTVRGPLAGGVSSSAILLTSWVLWRRIADLHEAAHSDRRIVDMGQQARRQPGRGTRGEG